MKKLPAIAALLALGTFLGLFVARLRSPAWRHSRPLVPTLRCTDAVQDLGRVWETDSFPIEFHLVNETRSGTFHVGPLKGGCACTAVSPAELTIAPGERAAV